MLRFRQSDGHSPEVNTARALSTTSAELEKTVQRPLARIAGESGTKPDKRFKPKMSEKYSQGVKNTFLGKTRKK
jgi:hypothetical protein